MRSVAGESGHRRRRRVGGVGRSLDDGAPSRDEHIRLTLLLRLAARLTLVATSFADFAAGFTIATPIRFWPSADIVSTCAFSGAKPRVCSERECLCSVPATGRRPAVAPRPASITVELSKRSPRLFPTKLYEAIAGAFAEAGAAEPYREAIMAISMVGGLSEPLLFGDGSFTPKNAIAALDEHLNRALPASGTRA